jgi:hypothetical protein
VRRRRQPVPAAVLDHGIVERPRLARLDLLKLALRVGDEVLDGMRPARRGLRLGRGDIIGITTTIKGIDCSHTGMCYRHSDGSLRLLHASLTEKKVILDRTLSEYLASVSKHTGIMVARPVEV